MTPRYVIELLGGAADGRRFRWASLPSVWLVPLPLDVTAWVFFEELPADAVPTPKVARYLPTGRRTTNGAYVYALERKD